MKPEHITERKLSVTRFAGARGAGSTTGKRVDTTWTGLCTVLTAPAEHPDIDSLPLFKVAAFRGDTRAKPTTVLHVDALCGDYDGGEVTLEEAGRRLTAAGLQACLYTTRRHTPAAPRWRVLAPLSGPIEQHEHQALLDLLNGALGGILAPESWDWVRSYFYGRVAGVDYRFKAVDGMPIDVVAMCPDFEPMPCAAPVKSARAPKAALDGHDGPIEDDVHRYLDEQGLVLSADGDRLHVACPWVDQHTSDSGASSTSWLLAGTNNYALGHFSCRHTSHGPKTDAEFLDAIGYVRNAFDVVTLSEEERAEIAERLSSEKTSVVVDAATGEVVEISSPKHSDDQLALEFAGIGQDFVRYTPGMGWMSAGEHHWGRDDHLHRMTLSRSICRAAAKLADKAPERKALASARTVNNIVNLAQSDTRLLVPASAWDADPFLLNTPDGIVDLKTGTMRPRARDLVTRAARVSPDFEAACPTWLRFLGSVCAGDQAMVDFMQRMLGYMLTGDRREQKLFFVWGKGSNGKSTLGELLLWLLGGYGLKLSSSVLMQSPHDRHPTELAQLHGVRAAVSSELEEGQFFNESRVKELTGDDTLSARFMRGDFFEFAMTHKHLVIGNHKPRLKGGDPAMARRLVLIPFKAAFSGAEADQDMPAKLRAEAPAILAWMVRGAVAWCADGLVVPPAVRTASDEYLADHNDVEQWMGEWCERSPEFRNPAGRLYESFQRWKLSRGERAPSAVTWAERMSLIAGIQKIRSNGAHYTGVRLSSAANSDAMVGADAAEFA